MNILYLFYNLYNNIYLNLIYYSVNQAFLSHINIDNFLYNKRYFCPLLFFFIPLTQFKYLEIVFEEL